MKETKKKNILIWGNYGFRNFGDELTLKIIFNRLKLNKAIKRIIVRSNNIEFTKNYLLTEVFSLSDKRKEFFDVLAVLKILLRIDILIFGGGTILQEYNRNWRGLFFFLKLVVLTRLLGKKVVLFNIGIGEINSSFGKIFLKGIIFFCNSGILREHFSRDFLIQMSCSKDKLAVAADVVYLTERHSIGQVKQDSFKVVVSVIPFYKAIVKNDLKSERFARELADSLSYFCDNYRAEICFLTLQEDVGCDDKQYSQRVVNFMRSKNKIKIMDWGTDENLIFNEISGAQFLIGMRLHSLIFSCLCETPMIAISYNPKIDYFMEEIGVSDFCLSMDSVFSREIINLYDKLSCDREVYINKIRNKLPYLKKQSEISFSLLEKQILN